jgi:tungstate transport system ATP-binding protein
VLDVAALDVRDGEVLGIIGPNGSGKSTLLRVLGLLEIPTAGEVRVRGVSVRPADGLLARRRMAIVFQQPLLTRSTVDENVAVGMRFRGVGGAEIATRVARWLARFGIAHLRDRSARTLSGGEAQRVALARALVLEPDVLLLDEPFAALDAPARAALIPELGAILRADAITTVLVTHDRAEAQALADRVAVLLGGRIRQIDETSRVFWAPASEEVARFVGVETIVDGEVVGVDGDLATVAVGERRVEVAVRAVAGERVRVAIRPEDVALVTLPGVWPAGSERNRLPGVVQGIVASTPFVRVVVDCGFPLVAAVTSRSVGELGLAPGIAVTAVFKATAAHVIRSAPTQAAATTTSPVDDLRRRDPRRGLENS